MVILDKRELYWTWADTGNILAPPHPKVLFVSKVQSFDIDTMEIICFEDYVCFSEVCNGVLTLVLQNEEIVLLSSERESVAGKM